jgi:hypothetical protein
VRLALKRSGGIAGLTLRAEVETEELPEEEARELRELVRRADIESLAERGSGPPRGADRFQYDVAVEDGDRRAHAVVSAEEVPPELRSALDRLLLRQLG